MNDLIRRQAAYDTLTEYYHHMTDIQHKALAEALSRVPSPTVTADTDTVSRQKMINTVNNLRTRCDNDIDAYHDMMVAAIDALPPSPSRPQWIPVTERLPEHSCQTLVTTKWDTEYSVEYGFYWGEDNKWGTITNNVIAWMPRPEPYHRP